MTRVALVHEAPESEQRRSDPFAPLVAAFRDAGVEARTVGYRDAAADAVRDALTGMDGALVWVDPLQGGGNRTRLDALLREVAAEGVFVSTHPAVILKMGTKAVLVRTQTMGWSTGDIHLWDSVERLESGLRTTLRPGQPRVLKQSRGNGGQGVWRVTTVEDGAVSADDPVVWVIEARRNSREERMPLSALAARCAPYFETGPMVDQPYLSPMPDGMVRCYLTGGRVAGFGHQYVTALTPPAPGAAAPPPPPRLYFPETDARFQDLRARMEADWVPELLTILDLTPASLPVLWDADFLIRPGSAGRYVLCEINVSAVYPFPDSALPHVVDATIRGLRTSR